MEHELQQRRGRLQALLPDAEMQDGEQPIEPAEEISGVLVSLCTALRTRRVLINLHVVFNFIKSCASKPALLHVKAGVSTVASDTRFAQC